MEEHWKSSVDHPHAALAPAVLEPGLEATITAMLHHRTTLPKLRAAVIEEIGVMIEDWADHTAAWMNSLHPRIRSVYTACNTKTVTQVPVLLHLWELCEYPGLNDLGTELQTGFPMTGVLSPGWLAPTH